MKKLRKLGRDRWRVIGSILVALLASVGLLIYRLGSLTGGLSDAEQQQRAFASSWHHIAQNPLNAPLTVMQWLTLQLFGSHGIAASRLASALFGFLALGAFAYVLKRWYGTRTAVFGSVLFATSAWFLHVSRYAGTEVMYLWAVPTLLAAHIAWDRYAKHAITSFLVLAVLAILLYIPGMIWLIVASLVLQPHHLIATWRHLKRAWQRLLLPVFGLAMLAPLALAILRRPALGQTWLGLPPSFSDSSEIPRRLAQCVSFLIWRGPTQPELWLDRVAVLDIFAIAMVILGIFFYAKHVTAPRTRLLTGLSVVGALFFALGGPVGFSVLIPIIYLFAAGGVGYLLHEWLRVFPRNPLARSIGYTLLSAAILLSCTYNLRAYFVAWPHSPATATVFRNRH